MKAAFLAVATLTAAGVVFYFSTTVHATKASELKPAGHQQQSLPAKAFLSSLPLFFEPNRGQTAPQVKFLAHGSGYGLFLTADEAVLEVQHSALSSQLSAVRSRQASSSVFRMRLDGANASARVSGASPLPGKSNYFVGNDSSQWRQNIPQFARVEYRAVYPGVDLVYYGDQGQLEYDFRVAPGADPKRIALSFQGASARIDSSDLILSTGQGDVRFHAPRIYQPAAVASGNASGTDEKTVAGSFRQLAGNKIGFTIGEYDHSRELVIDPTLSYSSYVGGQEVCSPGPVPGQLQGCPQVAIDPAGLIYVAGSTTSTNFPVTANAIQGTLKGAQNIFIAVLNPALPQQLVYATYLGGSPTDSLAIDSLAGLAVDANFSIYVAGTTNAPDFPTTDGSNGTAPAFQSTPLVAGSHGFLSKLAFPPSPASPVYQLAYSTYLSGNGTDTVTGLAIDTTPTQIAYVTGYTTSNNSYTVGFPANPSGFQLQSNATAANQPQFFASMMNTDTGNMLYSTYFGGGNFAPTTDVTQNVGGGIAVDSAGNMYFTGTTNMLPPTPTVAGFPLFSAQQSCLNESSVNTTPCSSPSLTNTDAFVAKINPNQARSNPVYSSYLGGSGIDTGTAIAVDSTGNAYVTGLTFSHSAGDWACSCPAPFQTGFGGGASDTFSDAYIVKIGSESGSFYPLNYFTYLGGSQEEFGTAIQVDVNQSVHVTGTTYSADLQVTQDAIQKSYGGGGDAFVALISTTSGAIFGNPIGDYVTYLGGSQQDQGTGIAIDNYGNTYVAGSTQSSQTATPPFPITANAYQSQLNGTPDAFVSKIGAASSLTVAYNPSNSPQPSPVAAGTQVAFTFTITNNGPDDAFNVEFLASGLPTSGLASTPTGKVTGGTGNCSAEQGNQIPCNILTLAANAVASVEIDVTPAISQGLDLKTFSVSGAASANDGGLQGGASQTVQVVDFAVSAENSTPTITAGDVATIQVSFCPTIPSLGYSATITPTQTTSPSMVTASTPTFVPTTVVLSGSACGTTTLTIPTVARPVNTGSVLRRGSFYAAWLPIGGLSLVGLGIGGLGIGAGRKRRRWLVGAVLGLIAGLILLQSACGSTATTATTAAGTSAGIYTITIAGAAGTGASHNVQVQLQVN